MFDVFLLIESLDSSSSDPNDREYGGQAKSLIVRDDGGITLPSFWRVRTACKPPPATVNIASMIPRGSSAYN